MTERASTTADVQQQWERAAPGWARWEPIMADAFAPATEIMLRMADVGPGARVLDLACGAGSQSLLAAHRVGAHGHVVASDIAESMLRHVRENARASGLANITTLAGAAEDLELAAETFDARQPIHSRLGQCRFCCVTPASHHQLRDSQESFRSALPACSNGC